MVQRSNPIMEIIVAVMHLFSRKASKPAEIKKEIVAKTVTIAHCDIQNFSSIVFSYQNYPDIPIKLMTQFTDYIIEIVKLHDGLIINVDRQGVMSAWNIPFQRITHQHQAILCALSMISKLHEFNHELKKRAIPTINISIGVSTGNTIVDNDICVGDNIDSVEFLLKQSMIYKTALIVGEDITDSLNKDFIIVEIDKVGLIPIYTIIGLNNFMPVQHQTIAYNHHDKFLRAYREQDWETAIFYANELRSAWNSRLRDYYVMMADKCKQMKEQSMND